MWVIAVAFSAVELGLQEMIDLMPKEGGTLMVSEGVYEISEKGLRMPDADANVTITGCHLKGVGGKPRTISPGKVVYQGPAGNDVYWNGSTWKSSPKDALQFATEDEAASAALVLVTKTPNLIQSVSVKMVT